LAVTGAFSADVPAARLTPGLAIRDEGSAYWVARVILLVRREVCWCWRVRAAETPQESSLPPVVDSAAENLDLVRYEAEKAQFFATDPTARYLGEQMERLIAPAPAKPRRGSWAWLARRLELDETAQFLLGLVLAARLDAGIGPVLATCLNDRSRPFPTLALAQRLWHDPLAVAACADAAHPLFRYGLLLAGEPGPGWLAPLDMYAPVARLLADPDGAGPRGLRILRTNGERQLDARGPDAGGSLVLTRTGEVGDRSASRTGGIVL
jgi:vesicle-fusing ATPase